MTTEVINPWDEARKLKLTRGNHLDEPAVIDRGVNYFVLKLEEMGCTPVWSCEGHPDGFYIVFYGPDHVARAIAAIGIFNVELQDSGYSLRLWWRELVAIRQGKQLTIAIRNRLLRAAASCWESKFGELNPEKVQTDRVFVEPRPDLAVALRHLIEHAKAFVAGEDEDWYFEDMICDAEIAEANALQKGTPCPPPTPASPTTRCGP
jgi:hypothetical protein